VKNLKTLLKFSAADSITVIFIEDEEIITDIYRILHQDLVDQGYCTNAFFCDNIFDATETMDVIDNIDIVFCDFWLSSRNSLSMLKDYSKKIKKIFLVTGEDLFLDGLLPAQISLIAKPFDIEDIQYKIISQFD
jgi:DNA-binding NtrC family response regulator